MNKMLNELDIPADVVMDKKEQIRVLQQFGEDLDELEKILDQIIKEKKQNVNR